MSSDFGYPLQRLDYPRAFENLMYRLYDYLVNATKINGSPDNRKLKCLRMTVDICHVTEFSEFMDSLKNQESISDDTKDSAMLLFGISKFDELWVSVCYGADM